MPYRAGAMPYRAGAMARPFVQRPWRFGGQSVMHTYRPYGWGGRPYYAFAPGRRFYPGFYRSFYTPWARPIAYRWGWYGAPWYRSYGYYFQPYASYYSPAWWLTDWLIADMLAAQYAEAAAAPTQYAAPLQQEQAAPMDDEVKEQLRREVEAAAQAQQAQQSIDIGTALQDPSHIYAVSQAVGVTDVASNAACMVTTGDLLRVAEPVSQGAQAATMVVVSAKRGSCPVGSRVLVSLGDLQGFLNDFSERVEQGMGQMQQSQPSGTPEEGESQEMPPQ